MKNIVLVGFMGSGKSTIGKLLAVKLEMEYVNTDSIIEKKEGISIKEIFARRGEAYFRRIERSVIEDISGKSDSVIDTGGGVVLDGMNMKDLEKTGLVFCLNAASRDIYNRTKRHRHRPLLNVDDPVSEIDRILKERRAYYDRAEYQIETGGRSPDQVADEIAGLYKRRRDEA